MTNCFLFAQTITIRKRNAQQIASKNQVLYYPEMQETRTVAIQNLNCFQDFQNCV